MDPVAGAPPSSGPVGPAGAPPREALEAAFEGAGRWDDLVAALIERAASASDQAERVACFCRAAQVYEHELGDAEKAFITLQAAFGEDYRSDDIARELERLASALARWREFVGEYEAAVADVASPAQRTALLLHLARWHDRFLDDPAAAEGRLVAALETDPSSVMAARALVALCLRLGDVPRAVNCLVRSAATTADAEEKVSLLLEAASLCRERLHDETQAAALYAQVLALSPQNGAATSTVTSTATEALAELTWNQGDHAQALPLYERLAAEDRGPQERARYYRRAAEAALRCGEDERARAHGRAALGLDPSDGAFARAFAEAAFARHWWEEAASLLEWLLPRVGDGPERLELAARLGRALVERGDPARAVAPLESAIASGPGHRGCREAIVAVYRALGDVERAFEHQRALAGLLTAPEDRFPLLVEMGRAARDQFTNGEAALALFREAMSLRPDDRSLLNEMLELYTGLKQWKRAVEVLLKLAEGEESAVRARYLVAAANILHYELRASDEAVSLYEEVLDADPTDLKTFERIDKILTGKRAWRDEARAYRRMLKRLGNDPTPERRPTVLALWRGLGEIYRTRLDDREAAAAAFEVATQLDPDSLAEHEILAELFEASGPDKWRRAVEQRTLLFERTPDFDGMARHLRALRTLYTQAHLYDRVFCVCAVLSLLDRADARERDFYSRLGAGGPPQPRAGLNEELWQKVVYHPGEERRLSLLLSCVSPTIATLRAQDARAFGLKDRHRVDPAVDQSPLGKIIDLGARVLGVGRPALYVRPESPGWLDVAAVREHDALVPSFIVGADLLAAAGPKDVAFLVGRHLALLRFERLLLWAQGGLGEADLRLVVGAALKLCQPGLSVPGEGQPPFPQYLQALQRSLPPQALEPLSSVVPWLRESFGRLDLAAWRAAAEHTADRAGLLLCGDIGVAARALRATRGPTATQAIGELARWSVSEGYLTLREQLGLMAVPPGWRPQPPTVQPRIVHRT